MPQTRLERTLSLVLIATTAALIAFGFRAGDEASLEVAQQRPPPTFVQERNPAPSAAEPEEPEPESRRPRPANAVLITASRGDCWVVARAGSATGEVLFEGVLASGRTLPLRVPRLWVQLGAAANVDVRVNGKPVPDLAGTVELVAERGRYRTTIFSA